MNSKRLKQIRNQLSKSFQSWDFDKGIKFSSDETQTRDFLIEPFFEILGYNKIDDYLHEYIADMGTKRGRRVDMAIGFGKEKPLIFIECKKATSSLNDNHFRQLNEYCLYTESVKLGIITNGIVYNFYARSEENNVILNESPFFIFDITSYDDSDLEKLALFYRPSFDLQGVLEEAEDVYFLERFDEALFETLANPPEDFIKIIHRNMGGKRMTSKVSTQIYDLINSLSLRAVVNRITQKEIEQSKSGVITTSEELRAYNVVKTIIAMSSKIKNEHLERVSYKDFKGQFAIIVDDSSRNKICSLILKENNKKIIIGDDEFELEDTTVSSLTRFKKELVQSALIYLNTEN